jgi:hypothetical protein
VRDELRRRYGLRPGDVSMAPLGTASTASDANQTVVAGRFSDEAVPDIRAFVAARGGEVVSEVDERWTRSPDAREALEPAEWESDGRIH